ncbi:MAG: hypothetical protein OEW48_00820 [Phycisphaerae bacterium]|nr:hypothetical protein [Phycisphaerae bacterium]
MNKGKAGCEFYGVKITVSAASLHAVLQGPMPFFAFSSGRNTTRSHFQANSQRAQHLPFDKEKHTRFFAF